MLGFYFKQAFTTIREAKLRSVLTMMGVIIGVAAFVIVTSTFEGFRSQLTNDINSLGGNLVTVNSGQLFKQDEGGQISEVNPFFGQRPTLTNADLNQISKLQNVEAAAPEILVSRTVIRKDKESSSPVLATNPKYIETLNQEVDVGDFLSNQDLNDSRYVVLGANVVEELFSGTLSLGVNIEIGGTDFRVIGSLKPSNIKGIGIGPGIDDYVYISTGSARALGTGQLIDRIDIQLKDGADLERVASSIEKVVSRNHGTSEDFTVATQDELIAVADDILDDVKLVSQAVSLLMLFVGTIVILLIMLITVGERTKEIGVRKSIGATWRQLMMQFLVEAVVFSWVGSILGIFVGYVIGWFVRGAIDVAPVYDLNTLVAVMLGSTVIGIIGGMYPAMRAARMNPIQAVRYE